MTAVVAVAPCVRAETDPQVPVYTNADLLKFGDPEPVAPPATDADRQWEFVHDYIDRELSRIESDRRHVVERALAEPPVPAPADTWRGYGVYAPGVYGYGSYGRGNRAGRGTGRGHSLPRYDIRTARHGFYVPAQRFSSTATGGVDRGAIEAGGRHGGRHRGGRRR